MRVARNNGFVRRLWCFVATPFPLVLSVQMVADMWQGPSSLVAHKASGGIDWITTATMWSAARSCHAARAWLRVNYDVAARPQDVALKCRQHTQVISEGLGICRAAKVVNSVMEQSERAHWQLKDGH